MLVSSVRPEAARSSGPAWTERLLLGIRLDSVVSQALDLVGTASRMPSAGRKSGALGRNAATPSARSCVSVSAPASPSIGASRSSPSAALIIALTIWTASGPRLAISAASALGARQAPRPSRDHLVDEAERQRLLGREHVARPAPCGGRPSAEAAHQPLRARPARRHAEPGLRQAELDACARRCGNRRPPPAPGRRRRRGR